MNELLQNFHPIPSIMVVCLLAAEAVKVWTPLEKKHLPALCGTLGLVLGVVGYLFIPGYLPADNPLGAAAIGVVSGWAATGANQVFKQYAKVVKQHTKDE